MKSGETYKRIIVVCEADDANGGATIRDCLNTHPGINCVGFKLRPHKFNYANQLTIVDIETIKRQVALADVVIFSQVNKKVMEAVKPIVKEKETVLVVHGGSDYRKDKRGWNQYCNDFCTHTIIQADSWNWGANNPFMWMAVDVTNVNIQLSDEKLKIYHSASSPTLKGTPMIDDVINGIMDHNPKSKFSYFSQTAVSHQQHIEALSQCDVFVDQISLMKDGFITGDFGCSAREAAAMGKIVITNYLYDNLYEEQFGFKPKIVIANTAHQLEQEIVDLSLQRPTLIMNYKRWTHNWISQHSYPNAAKRLLEKIELI